MTRARSHQCHLIFSNDDRISAMYPVHPHPPAAVAAVDHLIISITVTVHLKHNPLLYIMLSGIKTGKKKKRKTANDGAAAVTSLPDITSAPSLPKKPPALKLLAAMATFRQLNC